MGSLLSSVWVEMVTNPCLCDSSCDLYYATWSDGHDFVSDCDENALYQKIKQTQRSVNFSRSSNVGIARFEGACLSMVAFLIIHKMFLVGGCSLWTVHQTTFRGNTHLQDTANFQGQFAISTCCQSVICVICNFWECETCVAFCPYKTNEVHHVPATVLKYQHINGKQLYKFGAEHIEQYNF